VGQVVASQPACSVASTSTLLELHRQEERHHPTGVADRSLMEGAFRLGAALHPRPTCFGSNRSAPSFWLPFLKPQTTSWLPRKAEPSEDGGGSATRRLTTLAGPERGELRFRSSATNATSFWHCGARAIGCCDRAAWQGHPEGKADAAATAQAPKTPSEGLQGTNDLIVLEQIEDDLAQTVSRERVGATSSRCW